MRGSIEVYFDGDFKGSRYYTMRKERNEWMAQQLKLYPQHKHHKIYFINKPTEYNEKQHCQRNTSSPISERTLPRPSTGNAQLSWRKIG